MFFEVFTTLQFTSEHLAVAVSQNTHLHQLRKRVGLVPKEVRFGSVANLDVLNRHIPLLLRNEHLSPLLSIPNIHIHQQRATFFHFLQVVLKPIHIVWFFILFVLPLRLCRINRYSHQHATRKVLPFCLFIPVVMTLIDRKIALENTDWHFLTDLSNVHVNTFIE